MILAGHQFIQNSLREVNPHSIAVAYIGIDWKDFVNPKSIRELIVSPTIGSNPTAIKEIINIAGWENVHFLDSLHAKAYLGDNSALVGSANLTKNGLDVNGLEEICVLVTDKEELKFLHDKFEEYKRIAKRLYPGEKEKKAKLKELENKFQNAICHRIIKKVTSKRAFSEYFPVSNDDFYIMWYQPDETKYNTVKVEKEIPEVAIRGWKEIIDLEMHVSPKSKIVSGKWILCWRLTTRKTCHQREKPSWMYIHNIIKDAVLDDEGYEDLVVQRKDLEVPDEPFDVHDPRFISAFIRTLESKKYDEFLDYDEVWLVEKTFPKFRSLIDNIKELYDDDV